MFNPDPSEATGAFIIASIEKLFKFTTMDSAESDLATLSIMNMPFEIHVRFVEFLYLTDLLSYAQVCQQFRQVIESSQVQLIRQWFYPIPLPGETIQGCIQRGNRLYEERLTDLIKAETLSQQQIQSLSPEAESRCESEAKANLQIMKARLYSGLQLFSVIYLIRHKVLDLLRLLDLFGTQEIIEISRILDIQMWIHGFLDLESKGITPEWAQRGLNFWTAVSECFPRLWPKEPALDIIYTIDSTVLLDEYMCRYPGTFSYTNGFNIGAVNIVKRWIETTDESTVYKTVQHLNSEFDDSSIFIRKDLIDRQSQIYLTLFDKLAPERTLSISSSHIRTLYFNYDVPLQILIQRDGIIILVIRIVMVELVQPTHAKDFNELIGNFTKNFDSKWIPGLVRGSIYLIETQLKRNNHRCQELVKHPAITELVKQLRSKRVIEILIRSSSYVSTLHMLLQYWTWIDRGDVFGEAECQAKFNLHYIPKVTLNQTLPEIKPLTLDD